VARNCVGGVHDFKTIILALKAFILTDTRCAKSRTWCASVILVVKAGGAADCSRAQSIHKGLAGCTRTSASR